MSPPIDESNRNPPPEGSPTDAAEGGPAPARPSGDDPVSEVAPVPPEEAESTDAVVPAPTTDEGVGDPSGDAEVSGATRRGKGAGASEERATPPPLERLEGAVEALLLSAGESLSLERMRDLLGLPSTVHVGEAVAAIATRWSEARLPVEIQEISGGHRVVTRPEYAEYVKRLWRRPVADRLSHTLLETLSIVAYKQPVARAEIERIRGVQCGEALRALLDRRLLKVAGRSDQPGRPLLYATTARFLELFGLAGLEDLPSGKDLARL